jgi:hypothetical protein
VVRLLLESSDAVVADLTQVAEGTAWELDLIRDEGMAERCVFVARADRAALASGHLARRGFAQPCHLYSAVGLMAERQLFRDAMLAAMRAAHGAPQ